jgi:hypothetical protein
MLLRLQLVLVRLAQSQLPSRQFDMKECRTASSKYSILEVKSRFQLSVLISSTHRSLGIPISSLFIKLEVNKFSEDVFSEFKLSVSC